MPVTEPAVRGMSFATRWAVLRCFSGTRFPRRVWRRGRRGGVLAILLVSALWMRRADDGSVVPGDARPPVAPAVAVPEPQRPSPIGPLLAHLEEDRLGGDTITLQRMAVADGAIEAQVTGLSRDDLVAWAERLTTSVGPRWRLVTVATDRPADDVAAATALIKWKGPGSRAARVAAGTETAADGPRARTFEAGLVRMARWSVISRLDVDAQTASGGRPASGRLPQASVAGQMTWPQLLTIVSDVERWAVFTAFEVVADADTGGEGLQLTARLAPHPGLAGGGAAAAMVSSQADGAFVAGEAERRGRRSPFAAAVPRTVDPDQSSVAVESSERVPAAEATVASRWRVQGIVRTVDGWRAALRKSDGDTRVVREGDVLESQARVTAISWDGVRVTDADADVRQPASRFHGRTAPVETPPPPAGGRP